MCLQCADPACQHVYCLYRCTAAIAAGALTAALPESSAAHASLLGLMDGFSLLGIAGFGVALHFIHIYVTPIKRMLQVLWAVGSFSALYLILTQVRRCAGRPVPSHRQSHRTGVVVSHV